jgi:hypothetical protein
LSADLCFTLFISAISLCTDTHPLSYNPSLYLPTVQISNVWRKVRLPRRSVSRTVALNSLPTFSETLPRGQAGCLVLRVCASAATLNTGSAPHKPAAPPPQLYSLVRWKGTAPTPPTTCRKLRPTPNLPAPRPEPATRCGSTPALRPRLVSPRLHLVLHPIRAKAVERQPTHPTAVTLLRHIPARIQMGVASGGPA